MKLLWVCLLFGFCFSENVQRKFSVAAFKENIKNLIAEFIKEKKSSEEKVSFKNYVINCTRDFQEGLVFGPISFQAVLLVKNIKSDPQKIDGVWSTVISSVGKSSEVDQLKHMDENDTEEVTQSKQNMQQTTTTPKINTQETSNQEALSTTIPETTQTELSTIISNMEKTIQQDPATMISNMEETTQKTTTTMISNIEETTQKTTTTMISNMEETTQKTTTISNMEETTQKTTTTMISNMEESTNMQQTASMPSTTTFSIPPVTATEVDKFEENKGRIIEKASSPLEFKTFVSNLPENKRPLLSLFAGRKNTVSSRGLRITTARTTIQEKKRPLLALFNSGRKNILQRGTSSSRNSRSMREDSSTIFDLDTYSTQAPLTGERKNLLSNFFEAIKARFN